MASSSLTFVLTFVALFFVASITAQATTGTSTGITSNTTSTGASTSGSSSTSGSTSTTGTIPASAIFASLNITFFTNTTVSLPITLNLPNIGNRAITPPKTVVVTIINGTVGATQATLRVIAFDSTKFSGNPYAAQPALAGSVAVPPGIFAQIVTSAGAVVESFNKPIEVTLTPFTNAAGWSLAYYQPNTTANARPAGNWIRDATTTCSTGGGFNYTAATKAVTYKVCKLGQFQIIAPAAALSTTGPFNAASPLSVSYITLVAMFAFSLLILS